MLRRRHLGVALASALVLAPVASAAPAPSSTFNEAPLLAAGLSQTTIDALGNNAAVVLDLLESGQLPTAQAPHLTQSLLNTPVQALRNDGHAPVAAPGLGGPTAVASPMRQDCVAGTGAYYDVWTQTGYSQESGTVTLGTTYNGNSKNDAFYASLGASTGYGNADMGIWTSGPSSTGAAPTWYIFEGGTYESHWTSVSFSQATYPTVYLDLQVGNNTLTLQIIDPTTGSVIGKYRTDVSANYHFNSRGRGVALYRFDSIAQNAENFTDGSTLTGQAWQNVKEYSGNLGQLVTSYGAEAGPQCSAAEVATISYTQTPWYDSNVSINY